MNMVGVLGLRLDERKGRENRGFPRFLRLVTRGKGQINPEFTTPYGETKPLDRKR